MGATLGDVEAFERDQGRIDRDVACGKLVEIGRHLFRIEIDSSCEFAGADEAVHAVRGRDDVVGHRLHHHEVDVRHLVVASMHRVERAHAVRDVAVHAQPELVREIGHRFHQLRIE